MPDIWARLPPSKELPRQKHPFLTRTRSIGPYRRQPFRCDPLWRQHAAERARLAVRRGGGWTLEGAPPRRSQPRTHGRRHNADGHNASSQHLESVREVYVFKHSFLSMRRIDANSRKARAVLVRFSKSLASRRHLPSQANVLSTTHRLGMTSKPTAVSDRLTISVSKWGKIFFRAWSNTGPWYPPSAKSFFRNGNLPNKVPRTRTPPSRSWILAGCTMACTNRPTVSTRMWRFLPLIFLPAS